MSVSPRARLTAGTRVTHLAPEQHKALAVTNISYLKMTSGLNELNMGFLGSQTEDKTANAAQSAETSLHKPPLLNLN